MAGIKNFTSIEILSLIESWHELSIENRLDRKSKLKSIAMLLLAEHKKNGYTISRSNQKNDQTTKNLILKKLVNTIFVY